MKRRRRPSSLPLRMRIMSFRAYGGKVIPPRSVVKLVAQWEDWDWAVDGRIFRIGYYGRMDGKDTVWLVNESGDYIGTTDQKSIDKEFEVLWLSGETDMYGDDRDVLEPVTNEQLLSMV